MGAKFVTEQHVTPYGIAETRRPFTMPEPKPKTEAEIKAEQKAEADKQFAAGKETLRLREEAEQREAPHVDAEDTDDAHRGKSATRDVIDLSGASDPHVATEAAERAQGVQESAPDATDPASTEKPAKRVKKKGGRKKKATK